MGRELAQGVADETRCEVEYESNVYRPQHAGEASTLTIVEGEAFGFPLPGRWPGGELPNSGWGLPWRWRGRLHRRRAEEDRTHDGSTEGVRTEDHSGDEVG